MKIAEMGRTGNEDFIGKRANLRINAARR